MSTGRNTTVRDKHRAAIRRTKPPCHICKGEIDYALRTPHPDSFEVDHVVPLNQGGADTLDNKAAAHRRCNRAKSDKLDSAAEPVPVSFETSRCWW